MQRMPSHSNVFQVLLVFHEESCINSRRIGILKCIEDATPFPWPIKVQMKCFFLLPNLKEQQNQEERHLPFLNISSSSRVIKV